MSSTLINGLNSIQKEFIKNLPAVLEKARKDGGIPGMSVAIMYKGDLVFAQGFGKRNRHDPFTKETVSHIASVSKGFTAIAIGELVAEGKVDWDKTPVSKYLPEFELKDPTLTNQLTFADMLSHRTPLPSVDMAWFRNKEPTLELIKKLKHLDFPSKMSPVVNYNNIIYAVAGEAAAKVAGIPFADLISSRIFEPLGFKDAGLSLPEMSRRANYAMPYNAASLEDAQKGIYEEGYMDDIPMADAPAGDIYMNVIDLARWGRVILKEGELDGKQVLNKENVQETLKSHNVMEEPRDRDFAPTIGYGFGWILDSYKGHAVISHSGDDDLVIAVLTNINVTNLPSSMTYYISDMLLQLPKTKDWIHEHTLKRTKETYEHYAKAARNDIPDRIKDKPHSHDLADYAGEYTNPAYGTVKVSLLEDVKALHVKVRTLESKLEHYHFDSFKGHMHDFTVKGDVFLTFISGSNGGVESVEFTFFCMSEKYTKVVTPK
ncbi:hypothetical protein FBU30_007005 [Linnemannia zychae]|nr:hypothetical protein FBU30_007005 [Linnemannia zychae]